MMIRIRRNRNVALAGLAVSALLAGAEKTIVINEPDEVYKGHAQVGSPVAVRWKH
jgi:hypothetical protein